MKTRRDLIKTIIIDKSNFEHIAKTGNINGTLLIEIERVMEEYSSKKFTQGYTCACANLVRKTGDADGTLECELLADNISTLEGLKNHGVDESDIEILKPTIAELQRKRALAGN